MTSKLIVCDCFICFCLQQVLLTYNPEQTCIQSTYYSHQAVCSRNYAHIILNMHIAHILSHHCGHIQHTDIHVIFLSLIGHPLRCIPYPYLATHWGAFTSYPYLATHWGAFNIPNWLPIGVHSHPITTWLPIGVH